MLDEDHVIRLGRYAISGTKAVPDDWIRDFFLPEEVDPGSVFELGQGLHEGDGVELIDGPDRSSIAREASIVIFRRGTIDAEFLAAHPNLQLIQRLGERSSGIDLKAAMERGIAVSCVPRPSLRYTAEHAVLLMLALAKRLVESDNAVRQARFDPRKLHPQNQVCANWVGLSPLGGLFQKTVGIVGLGEVGSLVATVARPFGARVVYTNRYRLSEEQEKSLGIEYASFEDLLTASDFVSLHATNIAENRNLIDAEVFARMKPSAYLINTSRGSLVDEDALFAALSNGTIAGAGLDVHAVEPRPRDRFSALPNVILTPHVAGGSRKDVLKEIEVICDNCRAALSGRPIRYRVA